MPGFVEIDLVGHEGGNAAGDHCYTLTVTDIATGWTENRSVRNKAEKWVFAALLEIKAVFPFPIIGIDSDNGGEFINWHLLRAGASSRRSPSPGPARETHTTARTWSRRTGRWCARWSATATTRPQKDALKPRQHQSWIFITDPDFAVKAARVLDLYARVFDGKP